MFERLFASLPMDRPNGEAEPWEPAGAQVPGFRELMEQAAGARFGLAIYRLHTSESAAHADSLVAGAYPELAAQAQCFGYDWYGCQYALDHNRRQGAEPLIIIFEPGTGEVLHIPETFLSFHQGIDRYRDVLADDLFEGWAASSPEYVPLPMDLCVGYRVPLFLGGSDTPDNFEVVDIDVYWTISGQLIQKVRGLPPGTPIRGITIE